MYIIKKILIYIIYFYQKTLSLDTGFIPKIFFIQRKTCMFYPTCSEYTKQAIEKYGVFIGIKKGIRRISRCHPYNTPSVDPLV